MTTNATSNLTPPEAVMKDLMGGFVHTQIIAVAADLGIADALVSGPKTIDQLAGIVGADPFALSRIMRTLASIGIFSENSGGEIQQNTISESLRADVPGSLKHLASLYGQDWYRLPWTRLTDYVRTGEDIPFERVHGVNFWEYLEANELAASTFNNAMTATSQAAESPITDAYDFTPFALIVDVGGGQGAMLAAALETSPGSRGILFDLPSVVEGASTVLASKGVTDRCEVKGGSFFESVPRGGDAYLLKFILHDWDDAQSKVILNKIREQIVSGGTLLLIERGIVAENSDPDPIKFMDLHMMTMLGGLERTESEFRDLLATTGFQLTRVIPTSSPTNILIEAKPL